MPNHCVDVVCLQCGARWCCRCGDTYPPLSATQLVARQMSRRIHGGEDKLILGERCAGCQSAERVAIEGYCKPILCQIRVDGKECGGIMSPGKAIPPATIATEEGTISEAAWIGAATLTDVLKCDDCGHSISIS